MPMLAASTLAPAPKRTTSQSQREELYRLISAGYFGEARVELIAGELLTAFPDGSPHDEAVQLVYEALLGLGDGIVTYRQNLIELPTGDALQPDLFVMRGGDPGADPLLIVEVAVSTLRRDRTLKSELYAAAGVEEYWIVNPRAGQIEVRSDPSGAEYVTHQLYEEGGTIAPFFVPDRVWSVDRLMPTSARS